MQITKNPRSTLRNASVGHREVRKVRQLTFTFTRWGKISGVKPFAQNGLKAENEFYISPNMVFSTSISRSCWVDHEKRKIRPEKCILRSSRGPKSQAFYLHFHPMRENFGSQTLCAKWFGSRERILYLSKHGVYHVNRQVLMRRSRQTPDPPWKMHLAVIARSEKSGILPLLSPDEGEFRESNPLGKMVWKPRTNFIFVQTWCLARQLTAIDV